MSFLIENFTQLIMRVWEHLFMSMTALMLGVIFAVPLGLVISRNKRLSNTIIAISSVLQTIPSLALLAMMVPIFGVGRFPAIIALFIYSLLPILRNTVLGMNSVNKDVVDAAKGMGLTNRQLIFKVQVPLSVSVIMAGIRLSAIYVVAWTSLASYIGAGGLGDFIFNGLANYDFKYIIMGTVPITLLALIIDGLLGMLEERLTPKFKRSIVSEGELA
ncbi:MAG TPA: ABC transporter permease [Erysipelotrichaceae bacterium]|nr:ABC transporter permease [Erysipelotrichaceae bacterium]